MSVYLPKGTTKQAYAKLREKWNEILKDDGFHDCEYMNRNNLEIDSKFEATPTSLGRSNVMFFVGKTYEHVEAQKNYYIYFLHYANQIDYRFKAMHDYPISSRTQRDFRYILKYHLDGNSVQEAYKMVLNNRAKYKRKASHSVKQKKSKSCIFFFKRIKEASKEFLEYFRAHNMSGID